MITGLENHVFMESSQLIALGSNFESPKWELLHGKFRIIKFQSMIFLYLMDHVNSQLLI